MKLHVDTPPYLFFRSTVAQTSTRNTQLDRCRDGDRTIYVSFQSGIEKDCTLQYYIIRAGMSLAPPFEILHHGGMHQRIECRQLGWIGKNATGQQLAVQVSVSIDIIPETCGKPRPQRRVFLHETLSLRIRVINRHAAGSEKSANG